MPMNNDNKHWVAAKVDIPNRHVTVYDPEISMTCGWFQLKNAKCLSVLFPYILHVHRYYNYHPHLLKDGTPNLEPFTISREEDITLPQQRVWNDDKVYYSIPENRGNMGDLVKSLLEAAGRTSATGTNFHTLPPSSRQCDGPYFEDGSDSRDEDSNGNRDFASSKLSVYQVPLKKRFDHTERVCSNEEDSFDVGGSDNGEDSSDESVIGSDLYKNEDDRKGLQR